MPSLRHCSGGPPPSAIHGRGRLPRHPCRGAPCAMPAFGLWERGNRSRAKATATATATARSTASRAGSLPQLDWVHPGEDWSADRPPSQASQLPQVDWVHPGKIGRLTGRHRSDAATRQASSHKKSEHIRLAFHHSTGRALARLQLLMLTHRPLERLRSGSAQWATRHGCRVSRARPWMADRGGPTEQDRSEGMPSLGEAPNERGKSALVTLALFQSDPL